MKFMAKIFGRDYDKDYLGPVFGPISNTFVYKGKKKSVGGA